MSEVKLSVIIPVYKAEKFLPACLDSLVAQPESAMEIIIVEDGSPDSSGEICDRYAAADSRIKVIHRPNGGVSSARNLGIDTAKGEVITFVDADDRVAPDYAETIVKAMEGIDLLCFQSCWEEMNGECRTTPLPATRAASPSEVTDLVMTLREENPAGANLLGFPWNKAFRRDILVGHGVRFPHGLSYKEDEVFVWEYLAHVKVMRLLPVTLYYYRILPGGLTSALSRLTAADWHALRQATHRVRALSPATGRALDALTFDVLERMFMEAYSLYKEGGDWRPVMKELRRYHHASSPGPVTGHGKVKLSLKLRHTLLHRFLFAMLKKKKY